MTEIDLVRTNPLVDPKLHIWGWEVPTYLFLGGLAAGIMVATALLGRGAPAAERSRAARWLPFAAPIALSLGMGALFLDLEHKAHVFRFYTAFRPSSPMSWGAWILLAVYPASLLLGLAGLAEADLVRLPIPGALRAFALRHEPAVRRANVALGIALGVYTGILLGTLGARAAWSSALLGPLFLASGLSAGAAFLLLFPLAEGERRALQRWDLAAIALEAALLALYLLSLSTAGERGRAAAALFLGGPYTALFFSLVVVAGLAVPLLLELIEARRRLRPTLVAPALTLLGGLSLRWILVAAGQP